MRTASRSCITGTYYVRHRLIWDAQVGAFGPGAVIIAAPPTSGAAAAIVSQASRK